MLHLCLLTGLPGSNLRQKRHIAYATIDLVLMRRGPIFARWRTSVARLLDMLRFQKLLHQQHLFTAMICKRVCEQLYMREISIRSGFSLNGHSCSTSGAQCARKLRSSGHYIQVIG